VSFKCVVGLEGCSDDEVIIAAGDPRSSDSDGPLPPATRSCRSRTYYDKDVYNGDIGYIDDVDPAEGEFAANFDGRTVGYGFGELDMLVPAYAATIHKSQGSGYSAVVIPVMTQHYAMLQRNLLYTGVTRGKKLVVLVGQKKAVAIAVRNVSGRRRWSKLSEWLASKPPFEGAAFTPDFGELRKRSVVSLIFPDRPCRRAAHNDLVGGSSPFTRLKDANLRRCIVKLVEEIASDDESHR
jgi:hypothetical protein